MRFLALPLLLLAASPALAQTTPGKLPPANPLPPPGDDEAAVLAPINALFAGLAARNAQAILAQIRPEGSATVAVETADGTRTIRHLTLAAFAAGITPGAEKFAERMPFPAIEIDGDMAMVWGGYVFTIDGRTAHCGTNHFSLFRENGQWKIGHIAWTQRTTNCAAG